MVKTESIEFPVSLFGIQISNSIVDRKQFIVKHETYCHPVIINGLTTTFLSDRVSKDLRDHA